MKPSKRIKELGIFSPISQKDILEFDAHRAFTSLLQYLDEEWERNKTVQLLKKECVHKWKPYEGSWGASTPAPKEICGLCGITV